MRESVPNDLNAFRFVYPYINANVLKKIESSEITKKTLANYRLAMDRLILQKDKAIVHMDEVDNPDILVLIADFFMRLAEAKWSIVSGIWGKRLIVILRNAGLHGDAGKTAQRLFGHWGGSAGGHRSTAGAGSRWRTHPAIKDWGDVGQWVQDQLRLLKKRRGLPGRDRFRAGAGLASARAGAPPDRSQRVGDRNPGDGLPLPSYQCEGH